MKIELRPITASENEDVYQMFQEIPAEEDGFNNPAHGMSREEFAVFCREEIDHSFGKNLAEGYVPGTYYLLFIDDKPIGLIKLRHFLNDFLRRRGGHIGYGIRPSCRGNKWGNLILAEVLKFAKAKGIDRALLTIRDYNIPSRKVCENNGGILEKIEPGETYGECFYWIDLADA